MDKLTARKAARFKCLHALYELTDGSQQDFFDAESIAEESGVSLREVELALEYLAGEGLVDSMGLSVLAVRLKHAGIKEVEMALEDPARETEHFPAMNITNHIYSMVGSQIQQGTHGSTQSMTATTGGDAIEAIKEVLKIFESHLTTTTMADDARKELEAELNTLRAQVESPKPKTTILSECLRSAKSIVEGVASTALGNAVLPHIATALAALA